MNEEAIFRKRVQGWIRLTELTDKAESSVRKMSGEEVSEFVRLYRKASADLSFMATQTSNAEVTEYLNAIVSRAYGVLYRPPTRAFSVVVADGLTTGAATVRRHGLALLLSALVFMGSAVFSFGMMKARPDLRHHFVSSQMEPLFEKWKEGRHEDRMGGESVAMTALYAGNNPRVGVMMTAVSIATFGVLTTVILWSNGSMVGALSADMDSVGQLGFLLSSIAPHGVSEVGGFLVTGAAGFVLAWALINPGRRTRGEAVRMAGKDAFVMLLVGVVMIALAAPIEGFFSFNPAIPQGLKVVFALAALTGWCLYFVGYGRDRSGAST